MFTTDISPNNIEIHENPPRFTWPMDEGGAPYTLEISGLSPVSGIPYNFYTPDMPLGVGEHTWRVNGGVEHKFTVSADLPQTSLPCRAARYENVSTAHPRLWLNPSKVSEYRRGAEFEEFYKHSVLPRIEEGFPAEPSRYPDDVRVVALWRANYMTCQAAMCYIRSLSIAGVLLEDSEIISRAKAALLEIAGWDYDLATGSTTRLYNDECAYRVGYALAYGYDWLYNYMTAEERETVFTSLYARTREIAEYAIIEKKIHNFPYDSHAVRSLSMMVIPACIAMRGEGKDEVQGWLDYALEYLSAMYTPWGGADGGWAEGPSYWTTGMAFVTEAIGFVRNYLGIDLFKRPFFQKTGDFMLNVNPPDTRYASFCDQSNQGEGPGPKMAFNMRLFSGVTGNGEYRWYCNRVMERSVMNPQHFSEKGWWDLYYDDMVFSHDYGTVQETAPSNGLRFKHFRDVGWVAVNKNLADPSQHIFLLTKASPFGSLSHSHADQGSFLLHAYGQPLIINSGHYVGYGTQMHLNWRKQTKSANTILIDGIGQYAGMDYDGHHRARAGDQDITAGEEKVNQLSAKGKIVKAGQCPLGVEIVADTTAAYAQNVPYLENHTRTIHYNADDTITITDRVKLSKPAVVSSLLHAIRPFETGEDAFTLQVENVILRGKVSGGIAGITQTDTFDGVDEPESEGLAKQYHLSINTSPAEFHEISMVLSIDRDAAE